jgi:hypothetical protein
MFPFKSGSILLKSDCITETHRVSITHGHYPFFKRTGRTNWNTQTCDIWKVNTEVSKKKRLRAHNQTFNQLWVEIFRAEVN